MHKALVAVVMSCLVSVCSAEEIAVKAGDKTVSAAAARAKPGDMLVLEAGEFKDDVHLGEGVTLKGAGAGKSVIIASGFSAVSCEGDAVVIKDVTIRGAKETRRGVNTMAGVRLERVRFEGLAEAAALMGAPLSDVVCCDFIDCDIGVRAIADGSPTVWGCRFRGGRVGVFAIGSPYVRNNLFDGTQEGVRIVPGTSALVRNNLFVSCKSVGVVVLGGRDAFMGPVVRNNIFVSCASMASGDPKLLSRFSHEVVFGCTAGLFRDADGKAELKFDVPQVTVVDPKITVDANGSVTYGDRAKLDGAGIRAGDEAEGTKGVIGPDPAIKVFGVACGVAPPPARFGVDPLIANSVAEEHQYLRMHNLPFDRQSLVQGAKGPQDVFTMPGGKKVAFDISRYFGEMGIDAK
ncbi:MAG: right-handed parallel beta-helix repeat-containing protein [Phycisphaerales bacterium]